MSACEHGRLEDVRLLIETGGQELVLLTNHNGESTLMVAAHAGHVDVSKMLAGKRLLAAKCVGGMAEDYAITMGHKALARMLRQARLGKAGPDVRRQVKGPCLSAEEEALAVERAAIAMAALLAEEDSAKGHHRDEPVARGRKSKKGGSSKSK